MAKRINTIQYNIRVGWPTYMKYDIDYFNCPRQWLADKSGVNRHRIYKIQESNEATIDELDSLTDAFNLWVQKISEI